MKYVYGLDISLSHTGVTVFDLQGNPVKTMSIPTTSKMEHKDRLKTIADVLLKLREQYETHLIVFESGFSRHAASTQAIFKTLGMIQYLFNDCEQFCFAPSSIKKIITKNGRAEKEEVQRHVLERFPHMVFEDQDQSDSCAAGMAYFITNNIIKV